MSNVETTTTRRRGSIRSRSLISTPIIIISSCHAAFGVANLGPAMATHVTLTMRWAVPRNRRAQFMWPFTFIFLDNLYVWRAEAANADAAAGSLAKLLPLASARAATIFLGAFPASRTATSVLRVCLLGQHTSTALANHSRPTYNYSHPRGPRNLHFLLKDSNNMWQHLKSTVC